MQQPPVLGVVVAALHDGLPDSKDRADQQHRKQQAARLAAYPLCTVAAKMPKRINEAAIKANSGILK